MTYIRVPITRITLHQDRTGWHAMVYDANGHKRSKVDAPTRTYVEDKIAEFWPDVPVEVLPNTPPSPVPLGDVLALKETRPKKPRKGRGLSAERKAQCFRILDATFGSADAQRQGFPDVDRAAQSAATLLAARLGGKVKYTSLIDVVKEWYWRAVKMSL
jgi:hypothetical protein